MAKRGFFAELQHQNQIAAKRQLQAERQNARAYAAAVREAERAQSAAERAEAQMLRATAAEQKEAEREAKRLHEESRTAEVARLNAQLAETAQELDTILAATLDVDDFVALEELRVDVPHPNFARTDLETPTPPPVAIPTPQEPVLIEPEPPKGLGGVFGGKKKHAEALAAAKAEFAIVHEAWRAEAAAVPGKQLAAMQQRDAVEARRLAALAQARAEYGRECAERDAEAAAANALLDDLILGLEQGADSSIQEYVGVVLGNSVSPEILSIEHEFAFDSELKELELAVSVSPPERLPPEKAWKYTRSKDEISATPLSMKDLKARYASIIHQVALRTLHEVFEADRSGHINTIALTVVTEGVDPATGRPKRTPLVAVAAERSSFVEFDLANIVPLATLQHLGASISKRPYDLVGIDGSQGVRAR